MSDDDIMDDSFDDDLFDEDGLDDFEGGSSFSEMIRENPLMKIGVVIGAFVVILGAVSLFGGEGEPETISAVMPTVVPTENAPGTEEVSPIMQKALEERNEQRMEDAIRTGSSSIPTPINTIRETLDVEEKESKAEDPLERWRRIQEDRQRKMSGVEVRGGSTVGRGARADAGGAANQDVVQALAEAMSAQMDAVLSAREPKALSHMTVTSKDYLSEQEASGPGGGVEPVSSAGGEFGAAADDDAEELEQLISAGTIEYAQMLTEANSDTPGPILGQIVSGPLRGSRILGTFKVEDELLVLEFNTVVVDGEGLSMEAVALDPKKVTPGMATEVDHRYFRRVILPAAASFLEGMGQAISEAGTTNVTVENGTAIEETEDLDSREELFAGISEATSEVGDLVRDEARDTEILVRVEPGTPMGLLFLQPVTR
jgi:intracellular multiplication protein IcmE